MDPANNQTDIFYELFRPRWSKTFALWFSGIVVCLIPIYAIIWFERHGSDNKRTVQVKETIYLNNAITQSKT